jgi:hypothetical protein
MYGAISISKGAKGETLAFVGTINDDCTRVFSDCKVSLHVKEGIPFEVLQNIFIGWAKSYCSFNKKLPNLIILYREGLSIPQTIVQLPKSEIPALEAMVKKMRE